MEEGSNVLYRVITLFYVYVQLHLSQSPTLQPPLTKESPNPIPCRRCIIMHINTVTDIGHDERIKIRRVDLREIITDEGGRRRWSGTIATAKGEVGIYTCWCLF